MSCWQDETASDPATVLLRTALIAGQSQHLWFSESRFWASDENLSFPWAFFAVVYQKMGDKKELCWSLGRIPAISALNT